MSFKFLLCAALVGFAVASSQGWQSGQEYTYWVKGRTLTGLPETSDKYNGVIADLRLVIRPTSEDRMSVMLKDVQFGSVSAVHLPNGWKTPIAHDQIKAKQLSGEISGRPFEVRHENGIIREIVVDSSMPTHHVNIFKAIVSQLQMDLSGRQMVKSHVNQLPEQGSDNGVFKTMEESVAGQYETTYDISPLPEYVLQSKPWLAPKVEQSARLIQVVKNRNFSSSEDRVGYHYGLAGIDRAEPMTNEMGSFFVRSSVTRAVLSGSIQRYTLQSASTTNKIMVSPTLNNAQKAVVYSHLNMTLASIQPASADDMTVRNPKTIRSIVYQYDESEHQAKYTGRQASESSEEQQNLRRHPRSAWQSSQSSQEWQQESWSRQPKIDEAPKSPFLPLTVGNHGQSIKKAIDIKAAVEKLAREIGTGLQKPEDMQKENVLAKFTTLTALLRLCDAEEMKQVGEQLYAQYQEQKQQQQQDQQTPKIAAWKAYRDAVAQTGTGPALLTIQSWIEQSKVSKEQAAELIGSLAHSTRYPTEEYMRHMYKLVSGPQVQKQALLNDTAILSYSTLVRKVYVDKAYSHNQYPVHAFGPFNSEQGKKFVTEEFIPYLKQQLHEAVHRADSHAILVYIRALGNTAHQRVMEVFEPYLEGEKQVSQFQRFQMVMSLDKFVKTHPKVARSVLYKIYQNTNEAEETRVAAVYLLFRSQPPTSMLQRMAQYTNIDTAEYVNSAVKSLIQSLAATERSEYAYIREAARSAEPLLTRKDYGLQYSRGYLRDYVVSQMNLMYTQTLETVGSKDGVIPKSVKYTLEAALGGFSENLFNVQAMTSSVEELTHVLYQQTESFHAKQQAQQQHQQQSESQMSPEMIYRTLGMKVEEREQFEAALLLSLSGTERYFSLNNGTINMLTETIKEIEEQLRQGQSFDLTKFVNRQAIRVSFPTDTGLPFVYTLNAPTVLSIKGQIRAVAEPQISGRRIQTPKIVKGNAQIRALASTKLQATVGFVAPSFAEQYMTGYDKDMQVYLPINSQMELDVEKKQMTVEIKPIDAQQKTKLIHYSTTPFVAVRKLAEARPLHEEEKHILHKNKPATGFEKTFGEKTGFAFDVKYNSDQKYLDAAWVMEQIKRHDGVSALLAPFMDETVQYSKLSIAYNGQKSPARKMRVVFGLSHKFQQQPQSQAEQVSAKQLAHLPRESAERQQKMREMASAGIRNVHTTVFDAAAEFEGSNMKIEYIASVGYARSPVDEQARLLVSLKKQPVQHSDEKPYQIVAAAKARVPNTNGLDFLQALKFEPTSTVEVEVNYGENIESSSKKIGMHMKLEKTEKRKQYLHQLPIVHQCQREMEQGNYALPACANLTASANLLDKVSIKIQYDPLSPQMKNATHKIYNALRYFAYYNIDENVVDPQSESRNEVQIQAAFSPSLKSCNVSLSAPGLRTQFNNIRVGSWMKQLVVVHPVFSVYNRFAGRALESQTYRPICVVDKSAAMTFDNKTYPIEKLHGQDWTVMMQYVPKFARASNGQRNSDEQVQAQQQLEQYSVLVRESQQQQGHKDVKILMRSPATEGRQIVIEMEPEQQQPKVTVDGKPIQWSQKDSADIRNGAAQVYGLPNGEVKVAIRHGFHVIYDGKRVKVTATHNKLRESVRGLCGTFTGEKHTDFLTPANCIARDAAKFVATYSVAHPVKLEKNTPECYAKTIQYVNVVSDRDAGRTTHHEFHGQQQARSQFHHDQRQEQGIRHQTRYITDEETNKICFTVRPVPACQQDSVPRRTTSQSIAVHCVEKTNVADLWKTQIDNGASPDFSGKRANKTLRMDIPQSCM